MHKNLQICQTKKDYKDYRTIFADLEDSGEVGPQQVLPEYDLQPGRKATVDFVGSVLEQLKPEAA